MRPILIAILVLVVGFGLFWALKPQAPTDIQSAKIGGEAATTTAPIATTTAPSAKQVELTKFSFTGYGPGKTETGTFKDAAVSDVAFDANGLPAAGKFVIKTASVDTGKEMLNRHLCSEDFFNCAANPEIVFSLKSVQPGSGVDTYAVSGDLTFNGKTQPIQFQATTAGTTFAADFKVDTTFFNFKYIGVDKEVRIQFEGEVN